MILTVPINEHFRKSGIFFANVFLDLCIFIAFSFLQSGQALQDGRQKVIINLNYLNFEETWCKSGLFFKFAAMTTR